MTALRAWVEAFVTGIADEQRKIEKIVEDLATPLFTVAEAYLARRELGDSSTDSSAVSGTNEEALLDSLTWLADVIDTILVKDFPTTRVYDNEREGMRFRLGCVRDDIQSCEGYESRIRNHVPHGVSRVPF